MPRVGHVPLVSLAYGVMRCPPKSRAALVALSRLVSSALAIWRSGAVWDEEEPAPAAAATAETSAAAVVVAAAALL